MPRIIFKCPYLKSQSSIHKGNMVKYIATRKGSQRLEIRDKKSLATKKQKILIEDIIKTFPNTKNLFEYKDYLDNKTMDNATDFISIALEQNIDVVAKKENYVDYIANRPRVDKLTSHGLFNGQDEEINLSKVTKEIAEHDGNIWLPIISLRREDATNTGFDNAERWKTFLTYYAPTIAENMKIPFDDFRWYAAFHDQTHHPHVHMICYSESGRYGFLNKTGIENIRSGLISEIFKMELSEIYEQKSLRRDKLKLESQIAIKEIKSKIENGNLIVDSSIEKNLILLSEKLREYKGKKVYGYLPSSIKNIVNEITDSLCQEPSIAKAYNAWYEMQVDILSNYSDKEQPMLQLSKQKEFRSIKNNIIQVADKLYFLNQSENLSLENANDENFNAKVFNILKDETLTDEEKQNSIDSLKNLNNEKYEKDIFHHDDKTLYDNKSPAEISVVNLFKAMGKLFETNQPYEPKERVGMKIDSKRLRKLREKKIALGQKEDDISLDTLSY